MVYADMTQALTIVILAAGKGTRMKSNLPKVLHPLAGRPLLDHCYQTARSLAPHRIQIVYGHGGGQVKSALAHADAEWVEQVQQLGTGHAVQQAVPGIGDDQTVLILYGDVPLLTAETLASLVDEVNDSTLALLTVRLDDPSGYGRIVRNEHGKVLRIVEEKDASETEKEIDEINTGILAVRGRLLKKWLSRLQSDNAQGEYYLTDIIGMAVQDGVTVASQSPVSVDEILGVNDKRQLAYLERCYQLRQAQELMRQGATLLDPARCDIRGRVSLGSDVCIDVNVIFEGDVQLGDDIHIGANCLIKDSVIGNGTQILPNTLIDSARIGQQCRIGPFARIRPQTTIADQVHIGNFVEVKKSDIAQGSKANHLTYLGDSSIGAGVNIGAGTITCNYDGANKFRTVIEDNVFIGSSTQLVAPVRVEEGATIGAGSTITKDAPAGELTLTRAKQVTIEGWKRPVKKT